MENNHDQPSLYVYYRIAGSDAMAARTAASKMLDLIEAQGRSAPRLMLRPEPDAEGRQTWMEVYEAWDSSSPAIVDRALAESGLAALIEGDRHLELFIDLPNDRERGDAT